MQVLTRYLQRRSAYKNLGDRPPAAFVPRTQFKLGRSKRQPQNAVKPFIKKGRFWKKGRISYARATARACKTNPPPNTSLVERLHRRKIPKDSWHQTRKPSSKKESMLPWILYPWMNETKKYLTHLTRSPPSQARAAGD
ncbi:predicted protein [Histoplasma capsulatum var. duboisii H88]|uniref:Predicted protein n=1 Tax=Ajellomyces capsulatus (strain H88) TaxID=544711 RepID=F0UDQ9_AJEC8|nr:predicted protein [Histoplasma capsulatum var. duboisii H88]